MTKSLENLGPTQILNPLVPIPTQHMHFKIENKKLYIYFIY